MAGYNNWPEEEIHYGSEYPELLNEPLLRDDQMVIPADSEEWHESHWQYSFLQTQQCLFGTIESLLPLIGRSIALSMVQRIVWMCGFNERISSFLVSALGLFLLWSNSSSIFHLYAFILYFWISTATLFLLKQSPQKGHYVSLVTFIYTVLIQFYFTDVEFMAFRGSLMIASMKQISLAYDARRISATDLPVLLEYIFNPSTLLFGPFNLSEQYYLAKKRSQTMNIKNFVMDVVSSFKYLVISLMFVTYSSCISDQISFLFNEPKLEYYTTAQAFRFSHYFVCYLSLFTALIGGFAESDVRTTDWTAIEWPRSLTEVVVFWNLPMHSFLHKYIFRKTCHNFGYFGAMISTFLASALLHGFNFQLTAVLLSLGFYAYVESTFRKRLAVKLSACIESRNCGPKCTHRHKKWNFWVLAVNIAFVFLNIFHLAYLGAPFQQIEAQQHGHQPLRRVSHRSPFCASWIGQFLDKSFFPRFMLTAGNWPPLASQGSKLAGSNALRQLKDIFVTSCQIFRMTAPSYIFLSVTFLLNLCQYLPGTSGQMLPGGMGPGQPPPPPNVGGGVYQQNVAPPNAANVYSGVGNNPFYSVNMVEFGPENGDHKVHPGFLTAGQTIDLYMYFPFYGGLYNYTTLSVNGYMSFATVLDQGPTINVGPDATDWPRQQDPAMIAPFLCKQQISQDGNVAMRAGVYYRLIMRQSMFGHGSNSNIPPPDMGTMPESAYFGGSRFQKCPGSGDSYVRCDPAGDYFLDRMMMWLQEGVAGATAFRADAAFIVTWYQTASAIAARADIDAGQTSTYQVIWLTDQTARLSYVILNYDKLGFDAADIRMNSRSGRCQALFNGGNHTGMVLVDPTQNYKNTPKVLAQRSGVPHMVRGRYMFRVDDVVRPGGCSNKTGGTYPMMIYPNIVNMLGEMSVDVNAICLDRAQTYILMIEQRQTATCHILNSAIARCEIPKIYDWGTKTVYFQPQSMGANDEKAFVGYIYFVPPTLDPMRLDIGNIYDWYKNPLQSPIMPLTWYPRNFTNRDLLLQQSDNINTMISQDVLYGVQLGLYVIGYKESRDDQIKKFRPEHRVLCRLRTYSNRNTYEYRYRAQREQIDLGQVEQWYMSDWERMNELYTFRVGYLKLAPISNRDQQMVEPQLLSGLVSAPISLHWLWTTNNPRFETTSFSREESDARNKFIQQKATEMCHDWYDEDGAQWNFIRETETNASCPCKEQQAKFDLGRFMPHPRCSQTFRDITCTSMIGAKNCYMSSSNIYGSYSGRQFDYGRSYEYGSDRDFGSFNQPPPAGEPGAAGGGGYPGGFGGYRGQSSYSSTFPTHYGQVCCYDEKGFLMQTTYQPVIKVIEETPYNPGFPLRAYEFGTSPYMGQFEVPGLSAFHHDYMPYFLCCKFAKNRCQLFYWRRPSSGCQQYQPPAIGEAIGAGTFTTIDNEKFVFNEPGVYNFLYIPKTTTTPEVRIQIRLERYPNRRVDFSQLGRYLSQEELVQPTNATVITGVTLEATGTDRVHVLARGDTRRFRYRTSVIVGNILRYFDTMHLQRFRGVLIYVNNVERGQPEVYVVLEEAQIGIRIRESYSMDIDRMPMYQESMGMLDITLSVPPQYGVRPDGDKTREQENRLRYDLPRVAGLMRPFPETATGMFTNTLTLNDVNSENIRQQIINNYRIPGSGEKFSDYNMNTVNQFGLPSDNMFTTSRDEDKKFEVFPEAVMKNTPIYKTAEIYQTVQYRFTPYTGQYLMEILRSCRDIQESNQIGIQPYQAQIYHDYAINRCPDNPAKIMSECGDNVPCLYDYAMLNAEILGNQAKDAWNQFYLDRYIAIRQYNSCGPINIEYPEYMSKQPALASSYMQGDTARFECFQTHWIRGDHEYKCTLVVDYNYPNSYRFEWNKGDQPWCRSRELDNFLKWLSGVLITIGIITTIILIFLCCWCSKVRHQQEREASRLSGTGTYDRRAPRGYDFDSMPRKSTSLSSVNQPGDIVKQRNGGFDEGRPLQNGRASPFTSASRSPETPELRARNVGGFPRPGTEEEAKLLGMNTSV